MAPTTQIPIEEKIYALCNEIRSVKRDIRNKIAEAINDNGIDGVSRISLASLETECKEMIKFLGED